MAIERIPLVAVASHNPVKFRAAQRLCAYGEFTFETVGVPSGVPDQPMGDAQTIQGAFNRARRALGAIPDAQYGLGLEGGCRDESPFLAEFAYCVIVDRRGRSGQAKSTEFFGPPAIRSLVVDEGLELGHAMDRFYGHVNSKQKGGAIGVLTNGVIDREALYASAVLASYIPFLRPDEYWPRR